MPLNPDASIEITAFRWVPEGAQGLVKDLRVRWALEEAGLDYRVRLIGRERPPGYLEDQPFNQVPCFRDEHGADLRKWRDPPIYRRQKRGTAAQRNSRPRYRAIQWTYAAVNSVEPFVQHRVLLDVVFAGEEWASLSKPTMDNFARLRLQQLSDRLGDNLWLDGDRFTIGDLMMVSVLQNCRPRRPARRFPEP